MRHEELHPKSPTTVFYRNDQQVVLFTELLGIQNDCPVIVTWYREEELFYGTLASIPASEDPDRQFRRTYATAIFLSPDVQPGKWTVGMYLLTGKELYRSYFHINFTLASHNGYFYYVKQHEATGIIYLYNPNGGGLLASVAITVTTTYRYSLDGVRDKFEIG